MPEPASRAPKSLRMTSTAFAEGGAIPREFTCQGDESSPPLAFDGVPADARFLAMIVDDPDAPHGTFTHWTWWDLPVATPSLDRDASPRKMGGHEGRNDAGGIGWVGPCPPSGRHRYFFRLYALRAKLELPDGAAVSDVRKRIEADAVAWGELMATYEKG